jgi:hypothetical protein
MYIYMVLVRMVICEVSLDLCNFNRSLLVHIKCATTLLVRPTNRSLDWNDNKNITCFQVTKRTEYAHS